MEDENFNKWWEEIYGKSFLSFKELAYKAYMFGINTAYKTIDDSQKKD
jgi:hypothetical protein